MESNFPLSPTHTALSQHAARLRDCAINSAREAAIGQVDTETAARIYRAARLAGVPAEELRRARRFLAAAERIESAMVLA